MADSINYLKAPKALPVDLVQDDEGKFLVVLHFGGELSFGIPIEQMPTIFEITRAGMVQAFAGNAPTSAGLH